VPLFVGAGDGTAVKTGVKAFGARFSSDIKHAKPKVAAAFHAAEAGFYGREGDRAPILLLQPQATDPHHRGDGEA